jgi:pimeloyl-ACP methyl ester carboxylesterase
MSACPAPSGLFDLEPEAVGVQMAGGSENSGGLPIDGVSRQDKLAGGLPRAHPSTAVSVSLVRWRLCSVGVFVAVASWVLVSAEGAWAKPTPRPVPNSTLPGAGAFEGPVDTVRVGGIRLGYRQFGRGPNLLMVTGDTAAMSLWTPYLLRPLAEHFRVTIFDNRGVGYSTDNVAVPMTVPLMARDTADLIRALALRRTTLVGWSMGGEIGITVAELYPHLLARLVTSGGDAGSRHTIPPPPGLIKQLNSGSLTAALNLLFPPTPAGQAAQTQFVQSYAAIPQEQLSKITLRRQERAELAFLRYAKVWNGLGSITAPVLVTNGALDKGVPVQNARNLHRRIPRSRLSIFPGAAHGMMFQDAAKFAAQVARFAGS